MIDPAVTWDQYAGWQRNLARTDFDRTVTAALTLVASIDHDQVHAVLTEAADVYDEALTKWKEPS